jgi:hypothetical protein
MLVGRPARRRIRIGIGHGPQPDAATGVHAGELVLGRGRGRADLAAGRPSRMSAPRVLEGTTRADATGVRFYPPSDGRVALPAGPGDPPGRTASPGRWSRGRRSPCRRRPATTAASASPS